MINQFPRREFLKQSFVKGAALVAAYSALPRIALAALEPTAPRTRFQLAFGSCNNQLQSQDYFSQILQDSPDAWIWLGDNVYSDFFPVSWRKAAFHSVKSASAYRLFRQRVPVFGTWDDHDYGRNNCGIEFKDKERSQQILLDFLDEPAASVRRRRSGVYASHTLTKGNHRVKIILLDERFFREKPGKKRDLLGMAQWDWFERELTGRDCDCLVIGSGSQVLSQSASGERWASYPEEMGRLLEVLRVVPVPTVFLSGDRHFAEVSRIRFSAASSINGHLYDFTSSGLTHCDAGGGGDNSLGTQIYRGKNYGLLTIEFDQTGNLALRFQAKDPQNRIIRLDTGILS